MSFTWLVLAVDLLRSGAPPQSGAQEGYRGDAAVIAAAGDIAGHGAAQELTAQLLDALKPDAILTLGDNAYGSGTLAQFQSYFAPSWGRHKAIIHPSPGNHDHVGGLKGYCAYFGEAAHCHGEQAYHSFDVGQWHLVSLDSGCSSPSWCDSTLSEGSPMRVWLSKDLASHPRRCTLVYWHHPRWSSGPHGSDERLAGLMTQLYDAGVDIVLTGHDHDYERFLPQSPVGQVDPARGIVEFVVGTGGSEFYGMKPLPNSAAHNNDAHGVLKLTLHPTRYDWDFVAEPGSRFTDHGSADCH